MQQRYPTCVYVALGHAPADKPAQQTIDPAYTSGAAFLKTIGFTNPAEIARVLDIAMNPNSMFIDHTLRKGSKNASVCTGW